MPCGAAPVGPWSALGSNGAGDGALNNSVYALAVSGSDLYVGGAFINAAGIPEADYIARWNGSAWSALGSNGAGNGALNNAVWALAVSGSDLYVGGDFTNAAGIAEADYVARWNGSAWSALGSNGPGNGALNNGVRALAVSGSDLYVGGEFTNAAGIAEADYVARWNGSAWSALGSNGAGNGALNSSVWALAVSGSDLYVGGDFTNAAGIPEADYVARWNGSAWSALGSNGAGNGALNNTVYALAVSGSDLYVGGQLLQRRGHRRGRLRRQVERQRLVRPGLERRRHRGPQRHVYALAVSGSDLYVGGDFTNAAGIPEADNVARWNGSAWSALGSNGAGNGALNSSVRALAVSGSDLYVGGGFSNAAGIAEADYVASGVGHQPRLLPRRGAGHRGLPFLVPARQQHEHPRHGHRLLLRRLHRHAGLRRLGRRRDKDPRSGAGHRGLPHLVPAQQQLRRGSRPHLRLRRRHRPPTGG